jgi:predicted TIM-barrel fold metal-dependent hydrolase
MRFAFDLREAGRLRYSSDHPWVDPTRMRDGLLSLRLSAESKRLVLVDNARRLFTL